PAWTESRASSPATFPGRHAPGWNTRISTACSRRKMAATDRATTGPGALAGMSLRGDSRCCCAVGARCVGAAIAVAFADDETACNRPAVGAPVVRVRPDGQRDLRRAALGADPVGDPAADGRGPGRVRIPDRPAGRGV